MRNVLAIDFGTKTGWATNVLLYDKKAKMLGAAHSGVHIFDGDISGWRYLAFKQWLDRTLYKFNIDHIIYEDTFSKSAYSSRVLHGFLAMVQFTSAQRHKDYDTRITMSKVPATTLKKFATGYGRASKDEMISEYKKRFNYTPIDDNEADALWLLEYSKK